MIRAGEEVQIIDNNTKDDLTEVTLAQIIYEEQKSHSRNVPLQTLKELIHARTEKVLADLREGPIGRLIPGPKGPEEKVEVTPSKDVKPTLVDQAKEKFEEMQHNLDERVRVVLTGFRLPAAAPAGGQAPERASRGALLEKRFRNDGRCRTAWQLRPGLRRVERVVDPGYGCGIPSPELRE